MLGDGAEGGRVRVRLAGEGAEAKVIAGAARGEEEEVSWRGVPDTARQPLPSPHVVVREGTVEPSGRFGELVRRQPEFAGG